MEESVSSGEGFRQARKAVEFGRFVKSGVRELDLQTATIDKRGQEILTKVEYALNQILEKPETQHFIDTQRTQLGDYLKSIPEERVKEVFLRGLKNSVKHRYLLTKALDPEAVKHLDDQETMEDMILSYGFDFFMILRMGKRLDVYPNTALNIARLAYRRDPLDMISLHRQYPEFPLSLMTSILVDYPKDPKGTLNRIREALPKLQQDFPQFGRGYCVMH